VRTPYVEGRAIDPTQAIEQQTDGSLVVRLRVDGLREVSDSVIGLGEDAEVVAPPALRALVARRLAAAAARYRPTRDTDRGSTIFVARPAHDAGNGGHER